MASDFMTKTDERQTGEAKGHGRLAPDHAQDAPATSKAKRARRTVPFYVSTDRVLGEADGRTRVAVSQLRRIAFSQCVH
jgi:hypothetical protein